MNSPGSADRVVHADPPARPVRPVPPPFEGDDRLITAVITAGWVIALIVLLLLRHRLAPADRWWIWVAVAGCGLGFFGLAYVPYLKRSRERAALRREQKASQHERQAALGQEGDQDKLD